MIKRLTSLPSANKFAYGKKVPPRRFFITEGGSTADTAVAHYISFSIGID